MDNQINAANFIFTNFVSGIKGLHFDTIILLVNDNNERTINLVYSPSGQEEDKQIIKIPYNCIKDITFNVKVRMSTSDKKVAENETKSMLLTLVIFGGTPFMKAGKQGINNLLDTLSENYDKVDYNNYFEIVIDTIINNEEKKLKFTTDNYPVPFINQFNSNRN